MKRILIAASVAAMLAAAPAAFAQPHDDHHDDHHDAQAGGGHDGHHDAHAGGGHADWHQGGKISHDDWNRGKPVDWRGHHLRQPQRGYEWREVDGNYVLAAAATGLIAGLALSH